LHLATLFAPVFRWSRNEIGEGRVILLPIGDVAWIEADYYSSLHVGTKTYLIRRTMNELERDLDETFFCRIHRSAIVNLRYVEQVSFGKVGEHEVVLRSSKRHALSKGTASNSRTGFVSQSGRDTADGPWGSAA
jgi:DNA-binding LytR/AlgR family response regulator